jgi:heptosyltransferase I
MRRYLIVKMSSLGDVVHMLPAITDMTRIHPELKFDWVVEKGFAEIPAWHSAVENIIPIQLRQWRKAPWQAVKSGAWRAFKHNLQSRSYDGVLDAQGLFKSSIVSCFAKGPRIGLDRHSAREGLASVLYHQKIAVSPHQHAVTRLREYFAKIFDYPIPTSPPDFGIDINQLSQLKVSTNYIVFLHGTTWDTKHWPLAYWEKLIKLATESEIEVYLPWGSDAERQRAEQLAAICPDNVRVLPKLSLREITYVLAKAKAIVAVDTGLGHIAAALGRPVLSLYGPTDPGLTGAYGPHSQHVGATLPCSPCFKRTCALNESGPIQPPCFRAITPERVWERLHSMVVNDSAQSLQS